MQTLKTGRKQTKNERQPTNTTETQEPWPDLGTSCHKGSAVAAHVHHCSAPEEELEEAVAVAALRASADLGAAGDDIHGVS